MKILLVGTGGYAGLYVRELLAARDRRIEWEGVVDPYFDLCPQKNDILARGIPVYDTMEEFYREHSADLAVIVVPTHLHADFSICALRHGSYVLCEKPAAPTVCDAERMLEAEKAYGRFIAIGYQWSYSEAMQALKKDILDGRLGKILSMKTAVSWLRNRAYYARSSGWAGKISKNGVLVLDSILSNACAHYAHNMLFLSGRTMDTSGEIGNIRAETYRANDIENFDTCSVKMQVNGSAELYFIASHAAEKNRNPEFVYSFENAEVCFSQTDGSRAVAHFRDGSTVDYGNPFNRDMGKLYAVLDAIESGRTPVCTVKTALPHVFLVESIYKSVAVTTFPAPLVKETPGGDGVYVEGLYEKMYDAYRETKMLSEVL